MLKNDELSSRVIAYIGIQVDRIYKVVLDITAMLVTVHRSIGYSPPQYRLQGTAVKVTGHRSQGYRAQFHASVHRSIVYRAPQ